MKVYLVCEGEYDDEIVAACFAQKEKAEIYVKNKLMEQYENYLSCLERMKYGDYSIEKMELLMVRDDNGIRLRKDNPASFDEWIENSSCIVPLTIDEMEVID